MVRISAELAIKHGWIKADELPVSARPKKARKGELEGEEQAELLKKVRTLYPQLGHLLIHIPNGGSRKNAYEGWRLKEQGVRAGVSDLLLPVARGGYFGLWIEFKAAPPNDAPPSDSQLEWLSLMQEQGYAAHLCLGVAAALDVIIQYLKLPVTTVAEQGAK